MDQDASNLRLLAEALIECHGAMWEANAAFLKSLADKLDAQSMDRKALSDHWEKCG